MLKTKAPRGKPYLWENSGLIKQEALTEATSPQSHNTPRKVQSKFWGGLVRQRENKSPTVKKSKILCKIFRIKQTKAPGRSKPHNKSESQHHLPIGEYRRSVACSSTAWQPASPALEHREISPDACKVGKITATPKIP